MVMETNKSFLPPSFPFFLSQKQSLSPLLDDCHVYFLVCKQYAYIAPGYAAWLDG